MRFGAGDGEMRSFDEATISVEDARLLAKLRKDNDRDPWNTACALLDVLEGERKMEPMAAMSEAFALVDAIQSVDKWFREVEYALDSIRSEDDPAATFLYSDGGPQGYEPDFPHVIGKYIDDTEGEFVLGFRRTDAWRGYYTVTPAENSPWVLLQTDCILSGSADSRNLKTFDELLRGVMDERDVPYVRAFTRTSNVFSTGYDLFVHKDHVAEVERVARVLRPLYRDEYAFKLTALTGKDPADAEPQDHVLVKVAGFLMDADGMPEDELARRMREELSNLGVAEDVAGQIVSLVNRSRRETT